MSYKIDIYKTSENNGHRYALGIKGSNPLIVIGLNPSTADEIKPDATIRRIMGIAERANKEGFVMLNLYSQRATYPKDLDNDFNQESHEHNLRKIEKVLSEFNNPKFPIRTIQKRIQNLTTFPIAFLSMPFGSFAEPFSQLLCQYFHQCKQVWRVAYSAE